ncbi:hypothetical protein LG296_20140 (plasmid) [Ureibacillus chungkukjangi]|uniref:hypothetical protein n=1 Tax=Ureibacillus chungkukjangi TaxID=1202712 RepID=UPI000D33F18D|nr:hypothetical protein [Ureibacillus chungkukjangi]MCM3390642.1 hypothetical protein [Ureibacillus chungkukjangi]
MKKFLITLLVLIVLAFGIYFVVGLFNAKPPSPMITVEGKKIEVAQGSYCWDGLFNYSICADSISPPMLIEHQEIKPVIVSPESELKIEFKKEPNENTLGANIWPNDNEVKNVSLRNNVLVAPKEKGVYVYDVYARWEEGDSSYTFVIEVR